MHEPNANKKRLSITLGVLHEVQQTLHDDLAKPELADFREGMQGLLTACEAVTRQFDEVAAQLGVELWQLTPEQAARIMGELGEIGQG